MLSISKCREKYYTLGRLAAVFIISPILILKGKRYNDNLLITIGILLLIWDGIKLSTDGQI